MKTGNFPFKANQRRKGASDRLNLRLKGIVEDMDADVRVQIKVAEVKKKDGEKVNVKAIQANVDELYKSKTSRIDKEIAILSSIITNDDLARATRSKKYGIRIRRR